MLNISVLQLQDIITYAVAAGIAQHEKNIAPLNDRLSRAEVKRYLVRMGYSVALMKDWEQRGWLHGEKNGETRNSTVYYSAAEIASLLTAIKTKQIILDNLK